MKHSRNSLRSTDRAFLKLIDELTERGIITWRREENELRATVELVLEVQDCAENEGDPDSDRLRDLIIYGSSTEMYCIQPVPFELLTDQFAAIDPDPAPVLLNNCSVMAAEQSAEEVAAS